MTTKETLKASEELATHIQDRLTHPAIVFPGILIHETMKELQSGIPIIHQAPWHEFQVPYALGFFLGATYDGNPNEVWHIHPAQAELYVPVKGLLQVECSFGRSFDKYLVSPADALLIPPGRWHFARWVEPGWCWVVKAPNDLQGDAAKLVKNLQRSDR